MLERNSKPQMDRKQYGRKVAAELAAQEAAKPVDALEEALWEQRYTLAAKPPKVVAFDVCIDVPWLGRRLPVVGEVR